MSKLLPLPSALPEFLSPYLPPDSQSDAWSAEKDIDNSNNANNAKSSNSSNSLNSSHHRSYPFITLTYAQSLDSKISIEPGTQTAISHLETKTMTHYLRSKHDGILIGINTFIDDNPSLNCRYTLEHKIKPIIIDPHFKLFNLYKDSRLYENSINGVGLSPIVVVSELILDNNRDKIEEFCDKFNIDLVAVKSSADYRMSWPDVFKTIKHLGILSVMVEGGARVINDLLIEKSLDLNEFLIDSLIVTIGPIFLGNSGVGVSPDKPVKLKNINWWTGIRDSVMCAKLE